MGRFGWMVGAWALCGVASAAEPEEAPQVLDLTVRKVPEPKPAAPAFMPGLVAAQTSTPSAVGPLSEPQERAAMEEIQVTGTRTRRRDFVGTAPLTVIDQGMIEATGVATVGQVLQQLPSQSNGINTQFNNGGDGSTRVDLRGLGDERTLVLLNGRRVVPGGLGADASVDLNIFPIEAVDRIEVLRDGASAIYGSDALSGVVNVITKRNYSGISGDAYYGSSQHGGGFFNARLTAGETTERASFLVSAQYYRQEPIFAGQRSFARSDLTWEGTANSAPSGDETTLGSSAPPEGLLINRGEPGGNSTWQGLQEQEGAGTIWFNDPQDGWRPGRLTGNFDVDEGDLYNYQPENYLVTPAERFNLFATGDFAITDKVRLYTEALYSNRQSDRLQAAEPIFTLFIGEGLTASGENVYNPFGRDFVDVRRRMVEAGNRRFIASAHTFRLVLGVDGEFPEGLGKLSTWTWDFHFNYGRNESTETSEGLFIASRLQNALGPSFFDAGGVARCGTPGSVIAGCVPLNIFGGPSTITQEMLDYVTFTGVRRGYSEQQLLTFELTGELFDLWDRAASLVVGFQHRVERGGNLPNTIEIIGDSTGNNALPTFGSFEEFAAYLEVNMPLLADVPGFKLLEIQAAGRVFDFDSFGTDFIAKVGALWQIYSDLSIRGNYSRAFRAPSVGELFDGATDSFPPVTDPCDTALGRSEFAAVNCAADGLPAELVTGQTQIRTLVGGNPRLNPETAEIITAGVVWRPTFSNVLDGLTLAVDYFNIGIEQAIQPTGASVILNNCYNSPAGERSSCDQIIRNTSNIITQIDDRNTNIGGFDTAGVDVSLAYEKGSPFGRFGLRVDGVFTYDFTATLPDGNQVSGLNRYDLRDTVGFVSSIRLNAMAQWSLKGFGLGYNIRYVGPIQECEGNNCGEEANTFARPVDDNVVMDVFARYSFSTPLGFSTLQAGINNFLDQEPPTIYAGLLANSDAANYDYLGRFFYVSLRHQL